MVLAVAEHNKILFDMTPFQIKGAKGVDFTQISEEYLHQILQKLNNRPRAKPGYRTPTQMLEHIKKVALQL